MRAQGAGRGAQGAARDSDISTVSTYRDLLVWQRAFALSVRIYEVTCEFPQDERFGLTAQLRRCGVSIPSNIAEGYCRGTTKDYIRFLWMANGSLGELETQLLIAREIKATTPARCDELLDECAEITKMLRALIRSLERRVKK